jgi:hypothetical protein
MPMPSRDLTSVPLDTPKRGGSIEQVVFLIRELIIKHDEVRQDSQRVIEEMRESLVPLQQEFSKVWDAVQGLQSKNNSTRDKDDVLCQIKRLTSTLGA